MPKTVVVPLDGSDVARRALPVADRLAEMFDAEVVLVTTPTTLEEDRLVPPEWLHEAARSISSPHVCVKIVDVKWAVDGIVTVVAEVADPMVCMATHGRGVLGTTVLGSVAQDVVRRAGAPVVLVGPHAAEGWDGRGRPLLVCHDGSAAADAVLPAAREWAQQFDVGVVLLHVFHPLDVESAKAVSPTVDAAVEYFRSEGISVDVRVVRNSYPVGVILDVAASVDASAIAISTHGRSGVARMTLGSVAGSVVHAAPCPVLAVRPEQLD